MGQSLGSASPPPSGEHFLAHFGGIANTSKPLEIEKSARATVEARAGEAIVAAAGSNLLPRLPLTAVTVDEGSVAARVSVKLSRYPRKASRSVVDEVDFHRAKPALRTGSICSAG